LVETIVYQEQPRPDRGLPATGRDLQLSAWMSTHLDDQFAKQDPLGVGNGPISGAIKSRRWPDAFDLLLWQLGNGNAE